MRTLVPKALKKSKKEKRQMQVLLGLVEVYLKTGSPVGSNTLKEADFHELSSATIRNYFASLEQEGYLEQLHTSGGRIPTTKAIRLFAKECLDAPIDQKDPISHPFIKRDSKEVAAFLQEAAVTLSEKTKLAVFLSAPRFDHDFITKIKLVPLDTTRALCIVITDFGIVQTELLPINEKLSQFSVNRIEAYFHSRLTEEKKPINITKEELAIAERLYNEILVRYIVNYAQSGEEEIYRTGFSTLLHYPEFHDPKALTLALSLFENNHSMRLLLRECTAKNRLKFWIGEELTTYSRKTPQSTVIAAPYKIHQKCVGAIGLLGPIRIPYKTLFNELSQFTETVSQTLTNSLYKYKIHYRQKEEDSPLFLQGDNLTLLEYNPKGKNDRTTKRA